MRGSHIWPYLIKFSSKNEITLTKSAQELLPCVPMTPVPKPKPSTKLRSWSEPSRRRRRLHGKICLSFPANRADIKSVTAPTSCGTTTKLKRMTNDNICSKMDDSLYSFRSWLMSSFISVPWRTTWLEFRSFFFAQDSWLKGLYQRKGGGTTSQLLAMSRLV